MRRVLALLVLSLLSVLVLFPATKAPAEISASYHWLIIDVPFSRADGVGPFQSCDDEDCKHGEIGYWYMAWDGLTSRCTAPDSGSDCGFYGNGFCHVRILDEDSVCMEFNSRLNGATTTGDQTVHMLMPAGRYFEEEDVLFGDSSDYDIISFYAPHGDSMIIERATTYIVEVTQQCYMCGESLSLEEVQHSTAVYIPCCDGRVGDANGVGGDEPTIGDINLLIDALFITGDTDILPCLTEADVNQSGGASPTGSDITVGDISILIYYVFEQTGTLNDCF